MNEKIVLIRKQNLPFTVNYPFQLNNGGINPTFIWQGTKGNRLDEKPVPIEVYEWLRDYTTTFKEGMLIVKEADENDDEEIKELINQVPESREIEGSILTEQEISQMLSEGNQNVLKSKLKNLVSGLSDEDQVKSVKNYVYRTAMEIGIDSCAKRKVLCQWYGVEYEDVKDFFENDEEK